MPFSPAPHVNDWAAREFERQVLDNDVFFARFGREPNFAGRRVLDLGSGHGAMSARAAERGAVRVVGVDPNARLVAWAMQNVALRFGGRLVFTTEDVSELAEQFELVVSKDTVEHIADVARTFRAIASVMTSDAEAWIGFSPFYFSPYGDHGRAGRLMALPWLHTLPWPLVRRFASRYTGRRIQTRRDLGLNGLTPREFRGAVRNAGLRTASIAYNRGERALLRPLRILRRLPLLERYMTVNVYAVLRKAE